MALVSIKTQVCDMCGTDEDVARFAVNFPGEGRRVVDLCVKDSEPLLVIKEKLGPVRKGPRGSGQAVVTDETIKRAKAARKRATAKAKTKAKAPTS